MTNIAIYRSVLLLLTILLGEESFLSLLHTIANDETQIEGLETIME